MDILITAIITALVIIVIGLLIAVYHLDKRLRDIEAKRHTHYTTARLEDAIALIVGTEMEMEVMQSKLHTAKRHLSDSRNNGPHGKK